MRRSQKGCCLRACLRTASDEWNVLPQPGWRQSNTTIVSAAGSWGSEAAGGFAPFDCGRNAGCLLLSVGERSVDCVSTRTGWVAEWEPAGCWLLSGRLSGRKRKSGCGGLSLSCARLALVLRYDADV